MIRQAILLFCVLTAMASCAQQATSTLQEVGQAPAFPGADGFGKYTTGGRGGKVYFVTNLNDKGPGSFREALQKKEPRIIVFSVSGTIELESVLNVNYPDVTIAGQTAPGDGICLKNYAFRVNASNVIIRYMRFRLGDERKVEDDAISGTKQKNVIIDHCSMSWATDECASFYHNENFTLQWCIISESLNMSVHSKGDHGYGGIWGGVKASFHHNLISSHNSRMPRFSGSSTTPNTPDELVDFRNNVIYNWMNNNTYGGERGRYNVVGNYYKPGTATGKSKKGTILNPYSPLGKFFLQGNYLFGNEETTKNNWGGVKVTSMDSAFAVQAFQTESIVDQSAEQAFERVLKESGASYKRDKVDARIVEEVRAGNSPSGKKGNGIIDSPSEVGGWPELKSIEALPDGDQDGMPDEWERKNKLNPKDPGDGAGFTISKTYSNVEVYINSLVEKW